MSSTDFRVTRSKRGSPAWGDLGWRERRTRQSGATEISISLQIPAHSVRSAPRRVWKQGVSTSGMLEQMTVRGSVFGGVDLLDTGGPVVTFVRTGGLSAAGLFVDTRHPSEDAGVAGFVGVEWSAGAGGTVRLLFSRRSRRRRAAQAVQKNQFVLTDHF